MWGFKRQPNTMFLNGPLKPVSLLPSDSPPLGGDCSYWLFDSRPRSDFTHADSPWLYSLVSRTESVQMLVKTIFKVPFSIEVMPEMPVCKER